MRNTLKLVMQKWNWPSTWGWDYPMVAMCATRLLEPETALGSFAERCAEEYLPQKRAQLSKLSGYAFICREMGAMLKASFVDVRRMGRVYGRKILAFRKTGNGM